MVTKLKDARIVVKLDTKAATTKAKKLRGDEGRKEERKSERDDKRKEERREDRQKRRAKTRVAVIPAFGRNAGRLFKVFKGLVAIRAFEELAGLGAGFFKEAGSGKTFRYGPLPGMTIDIGGITDQAADVLADLSRAIASARSILGAILATTGQVKDVAFAQQMLAGKVDFEALGEFAVRAGNVNIAMAQFEALKSARGREAAGAILAQIAERTKNTIVDMATGSHN